MKKTKELQELKEEDEDTPKESHDEHEESEHEDEIKNLKSRWGSGVICPYKRSHFFLFVVPNQVFYTIIFQVFYSTTLTCFLPVWGSIFEITVFSQKGIFQDNIVAKRKTFYFDISTKIVCWHQDASSWWGLVLIWGKKYSAEVLRCQNVSLSRHALSHET